MFPFQFEVSSAQGGIKNGFCAGLKGMVFSFSIGAFDFKNAICMALHWCQSGQLHLELLLTSHGKGGHRDHSLWYIQIFPLQLFSPSYTFCKQISHVSFRIKFDAGKT